jgi:hypothetical protein
VLVVTGPDLANSNEAFGSYYAEILRAEGLNEFAVTDKSALSAATLAGYQVVLLASTSVTDAQVAVLTDWVQAGGNLIAMRPDGRLASLLGLSADTGDLTDSYVKVATDTAPGAGINGETMQFHGTADVRQAVGGATTLATLYSDAGTPSPTLAPAVTLRSVGAAGGQAAAFTYDLARSVVYTRQGNPAWAGQKRDGQPDPIRSDDLFFPDWLDFNKVDIPQADEQQRALANLVTLMDLDRTPLPRFWYLPNGKKAAVVLTGDDHNHGNRGTQGQFDNYEEASPNGCSVAAWECVRSTSYVFPAVPISTAEAQAYEDAGFEIALHLRISGPNVGAEQCNNYTSPTGPSTDLANQLLLFRNTWPALPDPVTNRTHCIAWSDWASVPKAELAHGIRFDTNYYYWPGAWVNNRPGVFTGSGFPMRFADTNGSLIDVYQAATQLTDESGIDVDKHIKALLDDALGPDGFYGVFTANMHTDEPDHPGANDIVAAAQARGVPVVSAKQMFTWIDGRNASSFQGVSYAAGLLRFTVARAAGAHDLQAMVPASSAAGAVSQIVRNGAAVDVTHRTVKGIDYATFDAPSGSYVVAYGGAVIPPDTTSSGAAGAASSTSGAGQTPAPGAPKAGDRKAPRVTIVKRTVRASKSGLVTLRVACPRGEIRCQVDLRLLRGPRLLVRKSLAVAGGKSANVTLRLLRSDRGRLVRLHSLLVNAAAAARDVAGNHATTTTRIRLLAPARRR